MKKLVYSLIGVVIVLYLCCFWQKNGIQMDQLPSKSEFVEYLDSMAEDVKSLYDSVTKRIMNQDRTVDQ